RGWFPGAHDPGARAHRGSGRVLPGRLQRQVPGHHAARGMDGRRREAAGRVGGAGREMQEQIVFFAEVGRSGEQFNIFTIRSDGTDRKNLTRANAAEMAPVFSPDRKKIAFAVLPNAESRRFDLHVVSADGSYRAPITRLPKGTAAVTPAWSPDGRQ